MSSIDRLDNNTNNYYWIQMLMFSKLKRKFGQQDKPKKNKRLKKKKTERRSYNKINKKELY